MKIKGVIFDLDGTVIDVSYDWPRIRAELGTEGPSILAHLEALAGEERDRKWSLLRKYEAEATNRARLKPGIRELLAFLAKKKLKTALVSNNSRENVDSILARFGLTFDLVLTRETGLWKPSGAPFLEVMKRLKWTSDECLVVGDTRFDLLAAKEAGIKRIFLISRKKKTFTGTGAEICPSVRVLKKKIESLL